MKMKRPLLYLGLAIVIALSVFAFEDRGKRTHEKEGVHQFFADLDAARVARIEIERLLDGVELVREGDSWSVREFAGAMRKQIQKQGETPARQGSSGGSDERAPAEGVVAGPAASDAVPADAAKVSDSLKALKEVTTTSLVSTNPEKQETYQVNRLAEQVRAYDAAGKPLANVYIGKQGPDFFSTYVRRDGEDRVYLTRTSLAAYFPVTIEHWRPKAASEDPALPVRERGLSGGRSELGERVVPPDSKEVKRPPWLKGTQQAAKKDE